MVLLEGKVKRKQCEEELQNIFREELGLENIDIERTHCSKGKTGSNKPRVIICKTSNNNPRTIIYKL